MANILNYLDEKTAYSKLRKEYRVLEFSDGNRISTNAMILLERFEHWSCYHSDHTLFEIIDEERNYSYEELGEEKHQKKLTKGWFYKPFSKILEYSYLPTSERTIKRTVSKIVDSNWIAKRKSKIRTYGNYNDYRILVKRISEDLDREGSGYPVDDETINKIKETT